jgi:hypothetical protein
MDINKYIYTLISAIAFVVVIALAKVEKPAKAITVSAIPVIKLDKPIVNINTVFKPSLLSLQEASQEKKKKSATPIEKRIIDICNTLNGKLEIEHNINPQINEIVSFNKIPKASAYCGATVYYILTKAGITYTVDKPYWASNNFIDKSKIVFEKGKWYIDPSELKVGYVTGYRLDNSKRIDHVGLYISHTSLGQELVSTEKDKFKVFEGNTSNPLNRVEQGFFYKQRSYKITYIRRYD